MLDVLGLDPVEEAAYRHLIGQPTLAAADLAHQLSLEVGEVSVALAALQAKGLVATSTRGTGQYVASPPAVALGSILVERQQDLRRAELELQALTEQYRSASERTITDVVDVVSGPEAVAQRFAQLQRAAQREVLALVRADVAVVSAEANLEEDAALQRGVRYDVVVERELLTRPGFYAAALEAQQHGETVRVVEQLPLRLIVVDRELALIPLGSSRQSGSTGALMVHPSGLLDSLLALFDFVWRDAHPIGRADEGPGPLEPTDRQILTLLLAGLTDHSVGSQLGLSLRTVQRRVAGMMEQAGVSSRIQLGRECERRGWIA